MFEFLRHSILPQARRKSRRENRRENHRTVREVLMFRDREIDLHRRAYKRSIGLTLQVSGRIRVSAPLLMPESRIQDFLCAHQGWIEANLQRYQVLRAANPRKEYREGESFPLLGETFRLRFEACETRKPCFRQDGNELVCGIPLEKWRLFDPASAHPELAPALASFYASFAKTIMTERIRIFSDRMGLEPSAVRFRSQKTRWGSCSSQGRISLNWRLAIAALEVIDYVVVHELSHLKHYNHSAAFWRLVATQVPDYARLRGWLREHQYDGDFLAKTSELHDDR